jgi:PAS domain S-box-containing protein
MAKAKSAFNTGGPPPKLIEKPCVKRKRSVRGQEPFKTAEHQCGGLEENQDGSTLTQALRFEQLLSELSSRFVNLSPEHVDREINDAMGQICELLDLDLAALWQFPSANPTFFTITHIHRPLGGPPIPEQINALETFPWSLEQVSSGSMIATSTDDLPVEASLDRDSYRYFGIKSMLVYPLSSGGGPMIGILGFNTVRQRRAWYESFVKRLRLMADVFANALARRNYELALREREEHLSLAAAAARAGVWVLYLSTGQFWITGQIREIFRIPADEGIDIDRFLAACHADDRESVRLTIEEAKVSGQHFRIEYRIVHRNGDICWLESYGRAQYSQSGKAERLMGVTIDIDERKRNDAESFRSRREMLQMERLVRMGELTASLAHELNQPLTAILSNARAAARFIESGSFDMEELQAILQDIVNDDKRAGDIIRSLRSMLKPHEEEHQTIPINDIVLEAVSLFHSEAILRNIRVEMDLADSSPLVYVNKTQLQQVMINLLMNAAESMLNCSENKKIIVRTDAATDRVVQVKVRDFGPGIEETDLARIFEPFYTTKQSGMGMGLALSRSIIEAHGGRIMIASNPDAGTTSSFDLPTAGSR